jgi:hypothetical protein
MLRMALLSFSKHSTKLTGESTPPVVVVKFLELEILTQVLPGPAYDDLLGHPGKMYVTH